jgi:hypothetical protein
MPMKYFNLIWGNVLTNQIKPLISKKPVIDSNDEIKSSS